jgi:hypothetical protein
MFSAEPGRISGVAVLNASGEFRLEKPIVCKEHIVSILPAPGMAEMGREAETARFVKMVPAVYLAEPTSPLRAKVQAGENVFTYELK